MILRIGGSGRNCWSRFYFSAHQSDVRRTFRSMKWIAVTVSGSYRKEAEKLQRAGRPAFDFHSRLRAGVVHDGDFVAVLKTTLVDNLLHFLGSGLRQCEGL